MPPTPTTTRRNELLAALYREEEMRAVAHLRRLESLHEELVAGGLEVGTLPAEIAALYDALDRMRLRVV